MAEVTEIISKDAINGIIQTDEALKKTIASLDLLLSKQKEVDIQLNKNKASFESNAEAKKKSNEANKQIDATTRELIKLDKQMEQAEIKITNEYKQVQKATLEKKAAAQESAKALKNEIILNDKNAGTLEKLAARNRQLQAEKKKLNLETEKGQKRLKEINNEQDKNNELIKNSSNQLEKQKINIGNYSSALDGLSDILDKSIPGFSGVINGIKGATKASLAFIATPLGAILAAIAGAVLLIRNAMNRSETATQKVRLAFSAFTGIVQGLLKYLQPLGEFLIDGLVKGFELVEKGVFKTLSVLEKGLRFVGLDEAADNLKGFTDAINESVETSKKLTEAELEYTKAQRESRKLQLQYQKQAEELRQVRDDESLSIQQRINANKELGRILDEQSKNELALGQKALDFANLRIKLEGETITNLDARAAAETELIDIQERITGQRSEQLVNINSLLKEGAEITAEIRKQEEKAAKIKQAEASKLADSQLKTIKSIESAQLDSDKLTISNKLETDKIITEANQKKLDILTEQEQAAAEQRKLINDASTQLAIDGARAIFEFQSIQSDKDIQRLENQKARELAIAGDDADKRAKIENKYAKRINAEKVKQAKRDKAAALFDIAVATATNAVKLFAQTIPPGILSAVAIAQGALQAALIASKPIPQFELGTNNAPGSGFIAGERGRELMQLSSGETMMVDSPTFFKGSKYRGATIKSNPETERIMSSVNDMSIINFDTMSLRKEQKRSTKQIVRAINNSNFRHNKAISQSYKERYLN